MPKAVVLDANVLLPLSLANLMLSLAEEGHFRPIWTDRILAGTAAAADRIGRGDIRPRIRAMRESFPEATVIQGEEHAWRVELPDSNDIHVVAAALTAQAGLIVTANLKDFPSAALPPAWRRSVPTTSFSSC